MVERFQMVGTDEDPQAVPTTKGPWVRYSDYAELETELAALKHDIERQVDIGAELATENERLREALDDPGDIGDSDTWVSERLACAQVAAEAFLSAILPEDAAGLVERLRQYEGRQWETTACYNGTRDEAASLIQSQAARIAELEAGLDALVNAKALEGVRDLVAGWNGENRPDGPYAERHPPRLGATLPETNCGAVYDLDEAMQAARALLTKERSPKPLQINALAKKCGIP